MSSLSISGNGQSLYQYLQTLNSSHQSSSTASTASTSALAGITQGTGSSGGTSAGATQNVSGGHHHHRGGGGWFFKQIQDAVTSALDSAKSSGSTTDPNQVIRDAIAKVLKNHHRGAHGAGGSSDSDGDSDGSTAGGATSSGSSSTSTGSTSIGSATSARGAFAQLLQSNGVDPTQFQKDFLAAIQSAQSAGTADASSVFTGFPTGSTVDTIA